MHASLRFGCVASCFAHASDITRVVIAQAALGQALQLAAPIAEGSDIQCQGRSTQAYMPGMRDAV